MVNPAVMGMLDVTGVLVRGTIVGVGVGVAVGQGDGVVLGVIVWLGVSSTTGGSVLVKVTDGWAATTVGSGDR